MRRFVAPGKVVLVGEYAVLDGAPAVVAAVDRGVEVRWTPGPERELLTPEDDRFARAALDAVDAPPGRYVFAEQRPLDVDGKPGLGGSAAAVVAGVLAGRAVRGEEIAPERLFEVGLRVHRAVQGSGSGVDVAASAWGGVIRFEAGRVSRLPEVAPVVVWSGASARTGPRVEAYLRWEERAAFVEASRAVVARFPADPVGALEEAGRLLVEMAGRAGVAYRTPALDRIAVLAREAGGAAKPSGAGGGDCAVALFASAAGAERFRGACETEGFPVLETAVARGAREEREER